MFERSTQSLQINSLMFTSKFVFFLLSLNQVPMKQHKDCNFSYAGLKTQVKLAIESKNMYAICINFYILTLS